MCSEWEVSVSKIRPLNVSETPSNLSYISCSFLAADVQSAGAGLLLAVALVHGSVQSVVEVATLLLSKNNNNNTNNTLKLPHSARRMLEKYLNKEESYAFKLLADKVRI